MTLLPVFFCCIGSIFNFFQIFCNLRQKAKFPVPKDVNANRIRLNALTDNSLMLQVKAGNLDKMGLLFERYHRPLFGFLFRMTGRTEASEDMVQTVFYRMLKYRHTFTGDGEFRTWMYHLARNVLADEAKQLKRSANHADVTDLAERIGGGLLADEQLQHDQDRDLLHRAMSMLTDDQREVLILSRFQELKYDEIARVLNTTEGAIKVRVHRAMNELKRMYLTIETSRKAHEL